jgi:hypothetical protein
LDLDVIYSPTPNLRDVVVAFIPIAFASVVNVVMKFLWCLC